MQSLYFLFVDKLKQHLRSNPAFVGEYLDDPSVWYLMAWSNQGTMLMAPIQGPPPATAPITPPCRILLAFLGSNESVCAQT